MDSRTGEGTTGSRTFFDLRIKDGVARRLIDKDRALMEVVVSESVR